MITEAEHNGLLDYYYRGMAITLDARVLREIEEANIRIMPHEGAVFEEGFESTLRSFTCGMVLACAADKVSSGHAVSPTPTSHGRNLSAFLYHHSQMSAQGSLDLSSPAYMIFFHCEVHHPNWPTHMEIRRICRKFSSHGEPVKILWFRCDKVWRHDTTASRGLFHIVVWKIPL